MNAFILDRYGGADGVRAGDTPDPELRKGDVLVQVHAAGVNLLDSKIRNGEFKRILPYRLPLVLGAGAGRVRTRGRRHRRSDVLRQLNGKCAQLQEIRLRFFSASRSCTAR